MTNMDRLFEDITPERYRVLRDRFDQFIENLDVDVPVIKVYDPLRKKQLDQLEVIREISMVLQHKKDEDVLKAKQAAEEASKAEAEAEKEGAEEKVEDKEGDETTETEKKDINEEQQKETVQSLYKA